MVCQAADSVFLLPAPGSDEEARSIEGIDLDRLRYGNVLEAYGTEVFGRGVTPELVFAWANFLYACSIRNGRKGSRFWIYLRDERILEVTRKPKAPIVPPEAGEPLLIDPRHEDPLDLIRLDLATGIFLPRHRNGLCCERATHTIDLLDLNKEDLHVPRRGIFETNKSLLRDILALGREGALKDHLSRKEQALRRQPRRTVWEEMKRQHKRLPELSELFQQLPEALSW
jgi:hypothetical protein